MEDFVTYEQALTLKKLGFNWELHLYYNNDKKLLWTRNCCNHNTSIYASAPTLAQAQKWLLSKGYYIDIVLASGRANIWTFDILNINTTEYVICGKFYDSYEESLLAGITECLKLLES